MMKPTMLKEFVVCEERINGEWGFYSIRANIDCSSSRFIVCASFDTYEEANEYIDYMRHLKDYFDRDDD